MPRPLVLSNEELLVILDSQLSRFVTSTSTILMSAGIGAR